MRKRGMGPSPEFLVFDNVTLRAGNRLCFPRTRWVMRANEQWAVLGPNGSGKGLLAQALAGQAVPVRGEVIHCWAEAASPPDTSAIRPPHDPAVALVSPATHRAVVAQESSFYQARWHSGLDEGQLNVRRFLSQEHVEEINPFEVDPRRTPRQNFIQRRREALRLLGLRPLWRRKLLHLSNGEMRKVLLARALLQRPRLLVLEEPFAGLDAATRRRLRQVIDRLMRRGRKVLVVTSRPDEIPAGVTHLLLVERQRVVAQGPKAAMLDQPLVRRLRVAETHAAVDTVPGNRPLRRDEFHESLHSQVGDSRSSSLRRSGSQRALTASSRLARNRVPRPVPAESGVLVAMQDVNIRYGAKPILSGVTWRLREGEHWALLGPNGSGKTTFLSLIQGDNPQVYSQNIRLFGLSPDSTQALWQARQHLGWVSPELHLHYPPEWSCLDVVCSGFFDSLGLYQPCARRQRQQARQWLRRLGLSGVSAAPLGELPLGDQRLVLLARAMVKQPRLLVLDEPCQGLDVRHRQILLGMVDRVVRATRTSVIFVTHHPAEVPQCITHVLRLRGGRIAQCGRLTARARGANPPAA
jgi:molybdate transport system ATP-binding protein